MRIMCTVFYDLSTGAERQAITVGHVISRIYVQRSLAEQTAELRTDKWTKIYIFRVLGRDY